MDAKKILDALLEKNRRHDLAADGPGKNNHVPMTLIALYRMGADPRLMRRYAESLKLDGAPETAAAPMNPVTPENWQGRLGEPGLFPEYARFFENRIKQASAEMAIKESLPALMKGSAGSAFHPLIRLGYALDYGSREEIAFSLAYWAANYQPSPDFDAGAAPVEPDALLSEIVKNTSTLKIKPVNSIVGRMDQVYRATDFRSSLKPVRTPDSNPLERISELLMETFTQTQDFTLLHAVTSCQAMRLVLPYAGDPQNTLSRYWHSVCAAYLTVLKTEKAIGKDSAADGGPGWEEILPKAAAADMSSIGAYDHVVKLVYSCWLESRHYKRDLYRALAIREIENPSRFV